ncbi:MAG: lysophospholipid acyltransferase family protein [Albidovulum sp.]|nr:lysophospholipid acyltransferase family protein [Albidovulum sp.]
MAFYVQWLRSLIFAIQMYAAMATLALLFIPLSVFDREWAYRGIRVFCRWVRFSADRLAGLTSEVRGDVPLGDVLVCAKHQSFFDIILICSVLPRPRFVMKKQLVWAPIVGYMAMRIGCVAIDRGKKSAAIKQLLKSALKKPFDAPAQLVIYPQGTRVAPGVRKPYKVGAAVLYESMEIECVPAATNVGVFWPRRRIYRKPGNAVVEFLESIPPGGGASEFLGILENKIESASNRLMSEAKVNDQY